MEEPETGLPVPFVGSTKIGWRRDHEEFRGLLAGTRDVFVTGRPSKSANGVVPSVAAFEVPFVVSDGTVSGFRLAAVGL